MGCGASSHAKEAEPKPLGSASTLIRTAKRRNSYQSPEMQLPAQEGGGTNPFAPNVVGTYSNHGMKPGAYGKPNAKINQDRGLITYPLADDQSMALLAVYDGHGANGELVSEFVMLKVPDMLEEAGGDKLWDDTAGLLKRTFDSADKQLRESTIASEVACALQPCNPMHPADPVRIQAAMVRLCTQVSGSTGVAVLLQGQKIWTANVGDSRAVIGRRRKGGGAQGKAGKSAVAYDVQGLTEDQKPDTPEEQARILAAGGYVSPESPQFGPARVWLQVEERRPQAFAHSASLLLALDSASSTPRQRQIKPGAPSASASRLGLQPHLQPRPASASLGQLAGALWLALPHRPRFPHRCGCGRARGQDWRWRALLATMCASGWV